MYETVGVYMEREWTIHKRKFNPAIFGLRQNPNGFMIMARLLFK